MADVILAAGLDVDAGTGDVIIDKSEVDANLDGYYYIQHAMSFLVTPKDCTPSNHLGPIFPISKRHFSLFPGNHGVGQFREP